MYNIHPAMKNIYMSHFIIFRFKLSKDKKDIECILLLNCITPANHRNNRQLLIISMWQTKISKFSYSHVQFVNVTCL